VIVDSSAFVAIFLNEPGAHELADLIYGSTAKMAAPNVLEASMVLRKHVGSAWEDMAQKALDKLGITVINFGPEHLLAAYQAFERFGKGHHPAALNFGDCIAYATARIAGQPLLYVGQDFALTDIESARAPE
jgi:ribonuclease VapC